VDVKGKTIVLGVTGGIAAYWTAEIIGALRNREADVRVIMTQNATHFISPLTLQTISGNKVLTKSFELSGEMGINHISYAKKADLILVAPATANFIGKIANGIADDVLTTTIIASDAPMLICPAMNDRMWANKIVQENVEKLKKYGYHFVDPEYGAMACGGMGVGRLASMESILGKLETL